MKGGMDMRKKKKNYTHKIYENDFWVEPDVLKKLEEYQKAKDMKRKKEIE